MTATQGLSDDMLKIEVRREADIAILDLNGNIIMGGGSAALRDSVRRLLENGSKKILVSFAGVKYIDSSGIGELVACLVSLNRTGGQLVLCDMPERVLEVMTLSSVLTIFESYDDEASALKGFD